jgi:hypothetical protein
MRTGSTGAEAAADEEEEEEDDAAAAAAYAATPTHTRTHGPVQSGGQDHDYDAWPPAPASIRGGRHASVCTVPPPPTPPLGLHLLS